MTKKCKTCKKEKPLTEYWKMSKSADGLQYSCKPCSLELRSKYATPDYKKQQYIKHTYGLTPEELTMMYVRQNYCCAICGVHADDTSRGLFIDHCHESNEVRALLCLHCNTAIGHFKDDPILMEKGAEYVRRYEYYKEDWPTEGREEAGRSSEGRSVHHARLQNEDASVPSVS